MAADSALQVQQHKHEEGKTGEAQEERNQRTNMTKKAEEKFRRKNRRTSEPTKRQTNQPSDRFNSRIRLYQYLSTSWVMVVFTCTSFFGVVMNERTSEHTIARPSKPASD